MGKKSDFFPVINLSKKEREEFFGELKKAREIIQEILDDEEYQFKTELIQLIEEFDIPSLEDIDNDTVVLTQKTIADLFELMHRLWNIVDEGASHIKFVDLAKAFTDAHEIGKNYIVEMLEEG